VPHVPWKAPAQICEADLEADALLRPRQQSRCDGSITTIGNSADEALWHLNHRMVVHRVID
jgi:hypothetical protein